MLVELTRGKQHAAIASLGAELRAWSVGGRELLWNGDPSWWPKTSPVLFPVVAWTRGNQIRVDGHAYPMDLHGIAPYSEFRLVSNDPDGARFELVDDAGSRRRYPFAFRLTLDYRLEEAGLAVTLTVANPGATPLPYACGLHPGFNWPFAGGAAEDYVIAFERAETPEVPVIAPGGLIGHRLRMTPLVGRRLPLRHSMFAGDALAFLDLNSRSLRFQAPGGEAITARWKGFRHCAVWSKPGAPLLSIESWTSHSDPEDFAGDLADKPGMILLAPGAEASHRAWYGYEG